MNTLINTGIDILPITLLLFTALSFIKLTFFVLSEEEEQQHSEKMQALPAQIIHSWDMHTPKKYILIESK